MTINQVSKIDTLDASSDFGEFPDTRVRDQGRDAKRIDVAHDVGRDSIVEKDVDPEIVETDCDYQFVDGKLVIEAETLPLIEEWKAESVNAGFTGPGYLVWRGASSNSDPTKGQMEIKIKIPTAGRYKFQWRTRVGTGNDAMIVG